MTGRRFILLIVALLVGTALLITLVVSLTALAYALLNGETRAMRIYAGLTAASALMLVAGRVAVRGKLRSGSARDGDSH